MKKTIIGLTAAMMFLATACTKSHKNDTPKTTYERDLSPEGVVFWDNQQTVNLQAHDIVMPNGKRLDDFLAQVGSAPGLSVNAVADGTLGPQAARQQLLGHLMDAALFFTNRNNFVHKDEGANKPAQNGLAYSWGQRNYKIRAVPPGEGNLCPAEVYGLDCSGLLYNLFLLGGIQISSGNAESQRQAAQLKTAILTAYPKLSKITVEDLGKILPADMQTGDIIYWLENGQAHHIGLLALDTKGSLSVAQSNGDETANCEQNYSLKRGPRFSAIANAILPKPKQAGQTGGYGDDYRILRVNTELSGKWTFSIKCAGAGSTLFDLALDFPVTSSNTFTTTTTATDYDGSLNTFKFTFTYDNIHNTLSCVYTMTDASIPNFERKDSFVADLDLGDDTGFLTAQNQYIHNGSGCTEQVRLTNTETQKANASVPAILRQREGQNSFIGSSYR